MDFKLAILVYSYKALHGLAPLYLSNHCLLVAEVNRRLRSASADAWTCVVPQTRTQFGVRSFAVAGPRVQNSLPAPLRDTNSIYSFRCICLVTAVVHSDYVFARYKYCYLLTYLLTVRSLTNCYHETSINKTVKLYVKITFLHQLY